jgi:hypothetical protein
MMKESVKNAIQQYILLIIKIPGARYVHRSYRFF